MKIELHQIKICEVVEQYQDSSENGVTGYGGKLNIRPAFQREFVYNEKQRVEVINTIFKQFPLNVMYWTKNGDGSYELLDGQQRTLSICQYVNSDFSVDSKYFHNLLEEEKEKILNYELMIYICEGTEREKLDWFEIINIAGVELTKQELRNAMYTGEWLTEAKRYFSKTGCPAHKIAEKYLKGSSIRQDYLETALEWISDRNNQDIEGYMAIHQHDTNCNELWLYFQSVINWVKATFSQERKEMKGLTWGIYYNKYKDNTYDPKQLESRIVELMMDDDVSKKSGIYEYLLDGDERHLNIRKFSETMARAAYERQKGVCPLCKKYYEIEQMEADHITPWSEGGKTNAENCQMLCKECNRRKSNK